MKKLIALFLASVLALSLSACVQEPSESTTDKPDSSQVQNSAPVEGDPAEYSMDFWAEKYPEKNICPFYIQEGSVEKPYYLIMEMGCKMEEWINTPFNWNGWHLVGNDIVNREETLKLTDDWVGEDAASEFSSFCTVTTEPYQSSAPTKTNDKDAQGSQQGGDVPTADPIPGLKLPENVKFKMNSSAEMYKIGSDFMSVDSDGSYIYYRFVGNGTFEAYYNYGSYEKGDSVNNLLSDFIFDPEMMVKEGDTKEIAGQTCVKYKGTVLTTYYYYVWEQTGLVMEYGVDGDNSWAAGTISDWDTSVTAFPHDLP